MAASREYQSQVEAEDGTNIAWRVSISESTEVPLLVICNGLSNDDAQWYQYFNAWRGKYSFVYWDYAGHGLSSPAAKPRDLSIEGCARYLQLVLERVQIETTVSVASFVLVGYSIGAQVALEYCHSRKVGRPNVLGVVILLGCTERPLGRILRSDTLGCAAVSLLTSMPRPIIKAMLCAPLMLPSLSFWLMCTLGLGEEGVGFPTALAYAEHLAKLDPDSFVYLLAAAQKHSTVGRTGAMMTAVERTSRLPALVISASKDLMAPPVHLQNLKTAFPDATVVHLPNGSHMALAGHADEIIQNVENFIDRHIVNGSHCCAPQ
mmetsp:Transcript_16506/g.19795  ORF Transcript_16506/g.19795 Transcript_16506/m.19795 type:complete len:320 (+) Transcript_16506:171-1130(+)|eukprot:CAMPEP_0197847060 /NCGR_PEP_ID=MMETSP1438-20131217/5176_1 /TAXON_ID=1461541 /ORGANISM="Pterosperma sp., Strain CCMP1384" /LENGTH=319 /DNA_ID=CAMNT_0043458873 /DNA_START=158 /DNA_END=1117 /DNA_ORIENTATION=+